MAVSPEADFFIRTVEGFAGQKFGFREEIALLYDQVLQQKRKDLFDEIIFLAKFICQALTVLRRSGKGNSETDKLSHEFQSNLDRSTTLIRALLADVPGDVKEPFEKKFLTLTYDAMDKYILFLQELSWIKNYYLDRGTANAGKQK